MTKTELILLEEKLVLNLDSHCIAATLLLLAPE